MLLRSAFRITLTVGLLLALVSACGAPSDEAAGTDVADGGELSDSAFAGTLHWPFRDAQSEDTPPFTDAFDGATDSAGDVDAGGDVAPAGSPIAWIRPSSGSIVGAAEIPIRVEVVGDVVEPVEFLLDGERVAELVAPPYEYSWQTAHHPSGPYNWIVQTRDSEGTLWQLSSDVRLRKPCEGERCPPFIEARSSSSAPEAVCRGMVVVPRLRHDEDVDSVRLYVDGELHVERHGRPWGFALNLQGIAPGRRMIHVEALTADEVVAFDAWEVDVRAPSSGDCERTGDIQIVEPLADTLVSGMIVWSAVAFMEDGDRVLFDAGPIHLAELDTSPAMTELDTARFATIRLALTSRLVDISGSERARDTVYVDVGNGAHRSTILSPPIGEFVEDEWASLRLWVVRHPAGDVEAGATTQVYVDGMGVSIDSDDWLPNEDDTATFALDGISLERDLPLSELEHGLHRIVSVTTDGLGEQHVARSAFIFEERPFLSVDEAPFISADGSGSVEVLVYDDDPTQYLEVIHAGTVVGSLAAEIEPDITPRFEVPFTTPPPLDGSVVEMTVTSSDGTTTGATSFDAYFGEERAGFIRVAVSYPLTSAADSWGGYIEDGFTFREPDASLRLSVMLGSPSPDYSIFLNDVLYRELGADDSGRLTMDAEGWAMLGHGEGQIRIDAGDVSTTYDVIVPFCDEDGDGSNVEACGGVDCHPEDPDETDYGCGACVPLEGTPGTPCGHCQDGTWTCASSSQVTCSATSALADMNACGTCAPLTDVPGASCDGCGGERCEYACGSDGTMSCRHAAPEGMVYIPSGGFEMGHDAIQPGLPATTEIDHAFYVDRREITNAEGLALGMFERSDWGSGDDTLGFHYLFDAAMIANLRSEQEGLPHCYEFASCDGDPEEWDCRGWLYCEPRCEVVRLRDEWTRPHMCPGYRLPTEAEWEYAARAGTSFDTHLGRPVDRCAVAAGPDNPPNAWGLELMLGNLSEMVWGSPEYYPPVARLDDEPPREFTHRAPPLLRGGGCEFPDDQVTVWSRDLQSPRSPSTARFVRTAPEYLRACDADGDGVISRECGGSDCDDDDRERTHDACFDCSELTIEVGSACGPCEGDQWGCSSAGELACIAGGRNECGGCLDASIILGSPCGVCGVGEWDCSPETGEYICRDDESGSLLNSCGGCHPLVHEPGGACGPCGLDHYVCTDTGDSVCSNSTVNACGGCADLSGAPMEPCSDCPDCVLRCNGIDALACRPR